MDWDSEVTKKHIKEAEARDLVLLGAGSKPRFRKYKFVKCGHIREYRVDQVTRYVDIKCAVWDKNALLKESYIVFMKKSV